MNDMLFTHTYGETELSVFSHREGMGKAAARDAAQSLIRILERQPQASCLFAAAPSQSEFLQELSRFPGIDWQRVVAFQMDEYIGLPKDSAASFASFLTREIFSKVPLQKAFLIQDMQHEKDPAQAYASLLEKHPLDLAFIGIGENGHIAFNDPDYADFNDPETIKIVRLDEKSRRQQVHDGCFPQLAQVPTQAYTLTIPVICKAKERFCIVPGHLKAQAVHDALEGPVTPRCPASILQRTPRSRMYIDREAAALLERVEAV